MTQPMATRTRGGGTRPRVSILLPVHQAAATLPACLRSIERQRESRWECVAVDDGSRDESLSLLRAAAERDSRFRVLALDHGGIVSALEAGLEQCRAARVARMDADDWMHRDRLAEQLGLLERRPDLCAVGCRVRLFPRGELSPRRRAYEGWLNAIGDCESVRREAFVECPIAHPSLMIRREVLATFGYRDVGWPEDYDLVLRLLAAGHELAVHPRRLLGWRDWPGRLSRTGEAYGIGRFTACRAAHLAQTFLAESEKYVLWGYGDTGRALRAALLVHGKTPSHIVELHPGRLGQRIHGAPVIAPEALADGLPRPVIASVAGARARNLIRAALVRMGYRELRDFVCAA